MTMQVEPREFSRENLSLSRSIEDVISSSSVLQVIPSPRNTVIVIPTNSTVREAIEVNQLWLFFSIFTQILATNNITSAPLFDFVNNNYYGFLDMRGGYNFYVFDLQTDILLFLVRCFINDPGRDVTDEEWRSLVNNFSNLQYRGVFYENCNVMVAKGWSLKYPS